MNKRLEAARQQAMKIDVQRKLGQVTKDQTQVTAQAVFSGGFLHLPQNGTRPVNANPVSGKDLAAQKAEEIHNKLGYMKSEAAADDELKDGQSLVRKYEEELEINDFASNVRYRLTSKETMTNLSEYYDVGVSVRGLYMPAPLRHKMEQNGERPLYLSLESVSEIKIQAAKKEIIRIIKEELLKLVRTTAISIDGVTDLDSLLSSFSRRSGTPSCRAGTRSSEGRARAATHNRVIKYNKLLLPFLIHLFVLLLIGWLLMCSRC